MSRHPLYTACDKPGQSTNNDPRTRSINRGAVPGSKEDVYRYMPWRAPGSAIPADPCGVAGGDQHGVKQTAGGKTLQICLVFALPSWLRHCVSLRSSCVLDQDDVPAAS